MCRDRKRNRAYVSACADPQVIETMRTYCFGSGMALELIPEKDGRTDLEALKAALTADAACVYLQQPNFFGNIEDASAIGEAVHAAGAKYINGLQPHRPGGDGDPRRLGVVDGLHRLGHNAVSAATTSTAISVTWAPLAAWW